MVSFVQDVPRGPVTSKAQTLPVPSQSYSRSSAKVLFSYSLQLTMPSEVVLFYTFSCEKNRSALHSVDGEICVVAQLTI